MRTMVDSNEADKICAAQAALELVRPDMRLGLGSGTTAEHFVALLGAKAKRENWSLLCAASSKATYEQGRALGLRFAPLADITPLDLAIDGADECTPDLQLIKGAGGALLEERCVAEAAKYFVVIADGRKLVPTLGAFPLPLAIDAETHESAAAAIQERLVLDTAQISWRKRGAEPVRTDEGHYLYDIAMGKITEPAALAAQLENMEGVKAHGLFLNMTQAALIAEAGQVQQIGQLPPA